MEAIDRQILTELAKDSSRSLNELAGALGIPSSTLHQKVKKFEAKGLIRGYRADINERALGLGLHALVSLTPIDPARPDDIVKIISPIEEIESCWSVAGNESYIVKVALSEPEELEALLGRIRSVANVSTKTTVILSTPFENRPPVFPEPKVID
jgi:Lrp/AsnC family transcriptional regulator, leucine-responsive regulatory protein